MKVSGISEQYDCGRDVYVQQEGAHVLLSVDGISGDSKGAALLTPAQARVVANALIVAASAAEQYPEAEES